MTARRLWNSLLSHYLTPNEGRSRFLPSQECLYLQAGDCGLVILTIGYCGGGLYERVRE